MSQPIERFEIRVDDAVLDDLKSRLERTRLPDEIDGAGWDYGIPRDTVRRLADYWRDGYDWRAEEARLNALPHFLTRIDEQSIHFIHARAARADAMPLLLLHGWPGSVVEFLDVIPRLAEEFHVIAPSLPGYGFSGPTRTRGWHPTRMARAFIELMQRLDYARYGAQGGDWGAQIATRIGALDPEHCAGIHLNMPLAAPPKEPVPLTDEDKADLAALARFQSEGSAYSLVQATKPQTLGVALEDSPAGLLAWIAEKLHAWSDRGVDVENRAERDRLITNVMIYWVTQTATSSARLYWEFRKSGEWGAAPPQVTVPTGVARFPKEILRFPRSWVERHYNVTRWTNMPRGGHFGAMEEPELFVAEVREFFRTVR
jgi:epoxide hydrolase